jgi:hypothetical protein
LDQSGHSIEAHECPLLGVERTLQPPSPTDFLNGAAKKLFSQKSFGQMQLRGGGTPPPVFCELQKYFREKIRR